MTKIAFINLKGGVGKTTLAVNFARYCGEKGSKVLLIDVDPQTNATLSCMKPSEWEKHSKEKGSLANIMGLRNHATADGAEKKVKDIIVKNVFKNVDLIPSHLDLFSIDLELGGKTARELILLRQLEDNGIDKNYDYIICDCPPNLATATQNAIAYCDHYLIPVLPDYLSLIGIALLINKVGNLSKDLRLPINNLGIVVSRTGRQSEFRKDTTTQIGKSFPELLFKTSITDRSCIAEAASKQKTVFDLAGTAAKSAQKEFETLFKEITTRLAPAAVTAAPVRRVRKKATSEKPKK